MSKSYIAKDKLWPKGAVVDTLGDWDKAAGQVEMQAGQAAAELEGATELLERKGRFVADGDFRATAVEGQSNRSRHISSKNALTGAAISDLEGAGYSTGQAVRAIDPKRGSRARGPSSDM